MKIALLLALVFFANTSTKPDRNGTQANTVSNGEGTPPVVVFNNDTRNELAKDDDKKAPKGDGAIEWANWALVAVGIITFWAMWRQANESSKATQAMRENIPHAKASAEAAQKSAAFFKAQNRPWVGMSEELTMLGTKSTKPGQNEFTVGYTLKNFGSAPALNTVVLWGPIVEDVNNYNLVKEKVAEARKSGENIVNMTGDLLLPSAEKYDTCLFGESKRALKIMIPGCVVYRDMDGIIHHTELSYWIDFAEGEKAAFHTAWFQFAD